jgi:pimeloyl-ACP methyl ester carboxylesterase
MRRDRSRSACLARTASRVSDVEASLPFCSWRRAKVAARNLQAADSARAKRLPDFERPTLLAWAPADRFFRFSFAERLLERFPNGRLERVEDARTFVSLDQPERLAELIEEFLRKGAEG